MLNTPVLFYCILRGYYDMGKNCRQFSFLTWNLFIDQFVYPLGGRGWDKGGGRGKFLAHCVFHFIREH